MGCIATSAKQAARKIAIEHAANKAFFLGGMYGPAGSLAGAAATGLAIKVLVMALIMQ